MWFTLVRSWWYVLPRTNLSFANSTADIDGWGLSPRGAGFLFGGTITKSFVHNNGIDLIARAHQLAMEGYKLMFDQTIVTVWSAPNYCYRWNQQYQWQSTQKTYDLLQVWKRSLHLGVRWASRPGIQSVQPRPFGMYYELLIIKPFSHFSLAFRTSGQYLRNDLLQSISSNVFWEF